MPIDHDPAAVPGLPSTILPFSAAAAPAPVDPVQLLAELRAATAALQAWTAACEPDGSAMALVRRIEAASHAELQYGLSQADLWDAMPMLLDDAAEAARAAADQMQRAYKRVCDAFGAMQPQ